MNICAIKNSFDSVVKYLYSEYVAIVLYILMTEKEEFAKSMQNRGFALLGGAFDRLDYLI